MNIFWVIVLAVYGLMIGSFINAFVWRFHEQHDKNLRPKKLSEKKKAELSIVSGRSMCPNCDHRLQASDLIPVISWLYLGGKCRYCKSPISIQYPIIELLTACLFVVSYVFWPYALSGASVAAFIIWLLIVAGFVAMTVYDVRWQLLPDKMLYPVVGLTVLYAALQSFASGTVSSDLIGYAGGVAACSGIFFGLYQMSDGRWIGGGDVKLGLSLGILAGSLVQGLLVIMLASVIGLVITVPFLIKKNLKMQSKIAFGPMLMLACYIVVLFGDKIVNWYAVNILQI
jgi:leader peptidase (prepilin peptidase) / N-methyltransferase